MAASLELYGKKQGFLFLFFFSKLRQNKGNFQKEKLSQVVQIKISGMKDSW